MNATFKDFFTEYKTKYPLDDLENIDRLFTELENRNLINFCVSMRSSVDGVDYWLQTEYYSTKLNKTIIWDYDASSYFDDENDLYDFIVETQNAIENFEAKLPKLL